VIGLVEDRDLDGVELDVSAAEEILEPAGTGDDDVDAVADGVDLRAGGDATEHGDGAQAERPGQGSDGLLDLGDQLTGGRQDQGTWPTGLATGVGLVEPGEHREHEGQRLAGSGASTTEHIFAS